MPVTPSLPQLSPLSWLLAYFCRAALVRYFGQELAIATHRQLECIHRCQRGPTTRRTCPEVTQASADFQAFTSDVSWHRLLVVLNRLKVPLADRKVALFVVSQFATMARAVVRCISY